MKTVEIYENLIPSEDCDKALEFIKELHKNGNVKKGTSNRFHLTNNNNPMSNYLMNTYGKLALEKYLKEIPNPIWVTDHLFAIYPPNAYMITHTDTDTDFGKVGDYPLYTFVSYLNDDYEGGEIEFPDLDIKIKPKKGMAAIFDGTLAHKVNEVTSGTRYFFGGGFTTNPFVHLFDFPIPSQS